MGYNQYNQGQSGIAPEVIATFEGKTIDEFAATYFAYIPDANQRKQAATSAVSQAGYAVGRGNLIYLPRQKMPDVQVLQTKTGQSYLKVKGKLSQDARSRAGLSIMFFPSQYGPEFNASILSYGFQKQTQQGVRVNVKKEDIVFEPSGAIVVKLRIFPDKTALPQAQGWIASTVLPPAGSRPAQGAQYPVQGAQGNAGSSPCFGTYNAQEPECQQCGDAGACSQETLRQMG